ncbi:acetoacetyl-CoA synthase [Histoplasma capsulatum var. duboisii H88]|uniref:Acetoacetyl-CoA synthase n=1 Tax=Ajellomyces capsulatus (strain H88) TaxID=544711 RepID=F0UPM3_AJEC8|nr:acetoacetyl-CoA synthase [Histoplasma capsulatum var. duboisii H88]
MSTYATFLSLYDYSVNSRAAFWEFCWHDLNPLHSVVDETARMDSIPEWFAGTYMNFAENILFTSSGSSGVSTAGKEDSKAAVTEVREGGAEGTRNITFGELRRRVGKLSQAMKAAGVKKGDRVAVVASNSIDTLVVFLALTALGGLFSSSSTDMGAKGILDRLLQIKPQWLFMDDWTMNAIVRGMEGVEEFQGIVSQPRFQDRPADVNMVPRAQTLATFLAKAKGDKLEFPKRTTGTPKCIVHSVGGIVLSGLKEGWIMYLSALQPLMHGCRIVLYDGSPFLPGVTSFIKLAGEQKVTRLGTSPRYMYELQRNGIHPREVTDLSNLEVLTSTGMVLSDALFEWFYDKGFPPNVQLQIFLAGPSLGTPIAVYDQTVEGGKGVKGIPLKEGVPGELVATAAFPNMPVMFWGENGAARYFDAYFARFDDVWTHGDFVMIHPATKQIFFLGRADGVLNPSGVRFGSSEVYSILENEFANEISDSICVGQRRPRDSDETVISGLSPRHVPKYVFETPEIPTTVNLKKVELPVKQIVSGKVIKPSGTLANPESLEFYYQFAEVEKLVAPSSKL